MPSRSSIRSYLGVLVAKEVHPWRWDVAPVVGKALQDEEAGQEDEEGAEKFDAYDHQSSHRCVRIKHYQPWSPHFDGLVAVGPGAVPPEDADTVVEMGEAKHP